MRASVVLVFINSGSSKDVLFPIRISKVFFRNFFKMIFLFLDVDSKRHDLKVKKATVYAT